MSLQALEIMELRDQLQDAQDAISEAHSNSAGLKEHNRQLEEQISRMEQQLADAVRCVPCRSGLLKLASLACACPPASIAKLFLCRMVLEPARHVLLSAAV